MRIESYNQVQHLYKLQQNAKTEHAVKAGSSTGADRVEISSLGRDMQIAKAAVKNAPDVREDVVNSLKADIESGAYQVTGQMLAERLLGER